jgi:hypothetical protein
MTCSTGFVPVFLLEVRGKCHGNVEVGKYPGFDVSRLITPASQYPGYDRMQECQGHA